MLRLKKIKVSAVMGKKVVSIKKDETIFNAVTKMMNNKIHGLPVLDENDKLKGIFTTYDLLLVLAVKTFNRNMKIETVFQTSGKLITINQDQSLFEALTLLTENSIRTLPVVDEQGKLLGILSSNFILNWLQKSIKGEENEIT